MFFFCHLIPHTQKRTTGPTLNGIYRISTCSLVYTVRGSIVVSIPACHAGDPGSIPGSGVFLFFYVFFWYLPSNKISTNWLNAVIWWYSVVVSISGCDPLDPGSNPGTAKKRFFGFFVRVEKRLFGFLSMLKGGLAHSVERSVRNRQAGGSKPPFSTFLLARVWPVDGLWN